jgi:hypothetical protein
LRKEKSRKEIWRNERGSKKRRKIRRGGCKEERVKLVKGMRNARK